MSQEMSELSSSHVDPEHTRDARLVAIETRQKLRDEHVDRRFDTMGQEFAGLDRRVSHQIGELNLKIDAGFRALTDELKSDRNLAETRVAKLYEDWRGERDSESKRPPSVKVSMLLGFLGIVFPTLSLAGGVIMLVINPIKDTLEKHIEGGSHWDGESRVTLLDERTQRNDTHAEAELEIHARNLDKLQEQRVLDAEYRGRMEASAEWMRSDVEALKEEIHQGRKSSTP